MITMVLDRPELGACVAVGTTHDCPVGVVTAVRSYGIQLMLLNFLTGAFDRPRSVDWSAAIAVLRARALADDEPATGQIFDTSQLGAFQMAWESALAARLSPRQLTELAIQFTST